jgi:hypothetical protein
MKRIFIFAVVGLIALGTVGTFAGRDEAPGLNRVSEETCVLLNNAHGRAEICSPQAGLVFDALMEDPDFSTTAVTIQVWNEDGSCTVCTSGCFSGTATVCWKYCRTSRGHQGPGC